MTFLDSLWFVVASLIILLILSMDPKSATGGISMNEVPTLFTSATDGQKFLQRVTWALILTFVVLTFVIQS